MNFSLFHFNDVYNVDKAPRFAHELNLARTSRALSFVQNQEQQPHPTFTIFSGDAFSPSVLATILRGEHMVPVLNLLKIDCACLGNHDLDFGLLEFEALRKQCAFPWVCSNVRMRVHSGTSSSCSSRHSSSQLGGCEEYVILPNEDALDKSGENKRGPRILVIGVVERDWLDTLSCVDNRDIEYEDMSHYVKRRVPEIMKNEALEGGRGVIDYVVCATHNRMANDYKLAQDCGGEYIQIILGGHDHHYEDTVKNNIRILNSGTDFQEFSIIDVEAITYCDEDDKETQTTITTVTTTNGTDSNTYQSTTDTVNACNGTVPHFSWWKEKATRIVISADGEEDATVADAIKDMRALLDGKMNHVIGRTKVLLDARFAQIRTRETNISNFLASLMTRSTGANIAILNSGSLRADRIIEEGDITIRDICDLLPVPDPIAVVEVTGETLLQALENGVSQYPSMEGRFPCVDGVRFCFDSSKPAGSRILRESVFIRNLANYAILKDTNLIGIRTTSTTTFSTLNTANEAFDDRKPPPNFTLIDLDKKYTLASKTYVLSGKDGYDCLNGATVVRDDEECLALPILLRNMFTEIATLEHWKSVMVHKSTVLNSAAKFLEGLGHKKNDLYAIAPGVDGRILNVREPS